MRIPKLRLLLAALFSLSVLFGVLGSSSAQEQTTEPTSTTAPPQAAPPVAAQTRWQKNGCDTYVKVSRYRKALRYRMRFSIANGDFRARPYRSRASHRLTKLRKCARTQKTYRKMLKTHKRRKRTHAWVARIDAITPYGKWAIPPYIVMCESGGAWSAYNPSGASGPYQLLGKGAIMPASYPRAWAQHHTIAYNLWAGGNGASHWVCA